jgi:hypothetical protein
VVVAIGGLDGRSHLRRGTGDEPPAEQLHRAVAVRGTIQRQIRAPAMLLEVESVVAQRRGDVAHPFEDLRRDDARQRASRPSRRE